MRRLPACRPGRTPRHCAVPDPRRSRPRCHARGRVRSSPRACWRGLRASVSRRRCRGLLAAARERRTAGCAATARSSRTRRPVRATTGAPHRAGRSAVRRPPRRRSRAQSSKRRPTRNANLPCRHFGLTFATRRPRIDSTYGFSMSGNTSDRGMAGIDIALTGYHAVALRRQARESRPTPVRGRFNEDDKGERRPVPVAVAAPRTTKGSGIRHSPRVLGSTLLVDR